MEKKELTIQDCSTIERMERAINEYLMVHITPVAIALGPHEYLSFREIEIRKLPMSATMTIGTDTPAPQTELSFRGLPIYSIEIDGIHILGQEDEAVQSMWYRERNRLPFLMMGIKGKGNL